MTHPLIDFFKGNRMNTALHMTQSNPQLSIIPQPKGRYAVRFQKTERFSVEVLARNPDEACAEAIRALQHNQGKVRLLDASLDYFTTETL